MASSSMVSSSDLTLLLFDRLLFLEGTLLIQLIDVDALGSARLRRGCLLSSSVLWASLR